MNHGKKILMLISLWFSATVWSDDLSMVNISVPLNNMMISGQPSPEDITKLKADGFTKVISFRQPHEDIGFDEKKIYEDYGIEFIRIPVSIPGGFTKENALLLDNAIVNEKGKILVHCTIGYRANVILALWAFHSQNKNMDEALDLIKNSGIPHASHVAKGILSKETK